MTKGDKRMEELRQNIIKLCNESNLPLEALVFVIRDVYRDVNETFVKYQQTEMSADKAEEE